MPQHHPPVRELVDRGGGHRGHRGGAGGHLEDPRAEPDLARLPGEPGEHRGGVGAVGLGGPHRVVAEPLGLLDDLELVLGGEAEAPVADVHAELHVQVSFQLEGIRCRRQSAWPNAWPRIRRVRASACGGAQPMRNRRHRSSSPIERLRLAIDCLPGARHARRCSRACAATSASSSAPTPTSGGGVCPMLAAHRCGGRTDFLSFAKSWDRFARARAGSRARRPSASSRILVAQLEASLARPRASSSTARSPSTTRSWRARAGAAAQALRRGGGPRRARIIARRLRGRRARSGGRRVRASPQSASRRSRCAAGRRAEQLRSGAPPLAPRPRRFARAPRRGART